MDAKILAACITSATAIFSVFIAWVLNNLSYASVSTSKQRVLAGSWRGVTHQSSGPDGNPIDVDLVMELKTKWRQVSGVCRVQGGGDELNVRLKGGYKNLDHVVLEYSSLNDNKVNFGSVILKLNGNGNMLHGKIIGYGNMSNSLIMGDIELKKIDS